MRLPASLLLGAALLLTACPEIEPTPVPTQVPDADADGVPDVDDCGPEDATVYPGAAETGSTDPTVTAGDGKDNDCDGTTDEGTDAYDDDGDGFSEDGAVGGQVDCDDAVASTYPGASEVPYDGIDQDCDGFDIDDVDEDGFPSDQVTGGTDCDDADPAVWPGAAEDGGGTPPNYGDDKDNDCDGATDEGMLDTDDDGDGADEIRGDCDDDDPGRYPGAEEIPYDGIDQDCDAEDLDDVDEDGFPSDQVSGGTDCDDTDPTVNAAATELCDGKDNDCDGDVPDDEVPKTWLVDADADGWGDDDATVDGLACRAPEGTTDQPGDCDDGDAEVKPDATEVCNGKDDDCNPETDEAAGDPWYPDVDGDGYGDIAGPYNDSLCTPRTDPAVDVGGDCDDQDATVYVGHPELCDGKDNDCDASTVEGPELDQDGDGAAVCDDAGQTLDCDDSSPITGPGMLDWMDDGEDNDCDGAIDAPTSSRVLTHFLYGEEVNTLVGRSLGGGYDADGDGWDDLFIGIPRGDGPGGSDAGQAVFVYGPGEPLPNQNAADTGPAAYGQTANDYNGESLTICPDLNGDGFADFVTGAYHDPTGGASRGGVFVYLGGTERITEDQELADADVSIINQGPDRGFGSRVRCVGDMNGDGLGELATTGAGSRMLVYFGREDWPATVDDDPTDGELSGPDVYLTGLIHGAEGGTEVAVAGGDINGDGFSDLIVGDPSAPDAAGTVFIVFGGADVGGLNGSITTLADVVMAGAEEAAALGTAVDTIPDANGDGADELVLAAPYSRLDLGQGQDAEVNGGTTRIYLGRPNWPAILVEDLADIVLIGSEPNEQAGSALAVVPDITGDGATDLLLTGKLDSSAGRLMVLTWPDLAALSGAGPARTMEHTTLALDGATEGALMGYAATAMGTFQGTAGGVVVSAYLSSFPTDRAGQVFFIDARPPAAP